MCGQSSPLIPQILGKPEIPDCYHMNEYGYEEQHDDLSVVSTLAGVLPDLELEHVAADVLDSLGLVEPHSGLLVLAHVVVVEEKVVHGGGHEDAPADGVRGLPDLLSDCFCVRDWEKFDDVVVGDVLESVSLVQVSLSEQEFHLLVSVDVVHELEEDVDDLHSDLMCTSADEVVLPGKALNEFD